MQSRSQEDFDRDFSDMVSGLRMAGFDAVPPPPQPVDPPDLRDETADAAGLASTGPRSDDDTRAAGDGGSEPFNLSAAMAQAEPDEVDTAEFVPPPLEPLSLPTGWRAVGWACAAYVLAVLVLTIVGVRLPAWAGWAAVIAFPTALFIGWRSLPKDRDPDDDGAVV
ncbi:MAG: hypothetical protein Q4G46_12535 [Propionibacteriaceae bacterium]|nr:hypothetical protein [Propionibacteriaceae bacterium]